MIKKNINIILLFFKFIYYKQLNKIKDNILLFLSRKMLYAYFYILSFTFFDVLFYQIFQFFFVELKVLLLVVSALLNL